MKKRHAAALALTALTLAGCTAKEPAPEPLPTLTTSAPATATAEPATPEHAAHPKVTAEQQAIALEAARIMTTWNPAEDATQTHAELRARHLMTDERAARVTTPERPSSGAEWTAAAKEHATSEPVVSLNTQADTPGVAVRATWSWKRPDGSALPRAGKPIRYYTFTFDPDDPTKINDYTYTDRTTAASPTE